MVKGSRYGSNCQKSYSADVAEYLKPVYITKLFEEEQFELQNSDFSSKVFLHTETKVESNKTLQGRHSRKGIQRTPPYLTYIRDSIDQGATRLGGYRSIYMFADGGSPFSLGFFPTQAWIQL